MTTQEAESLQIALTDGGVNLKNLDVDSYMKTIRLSKKLSTFLQERTSDIQDLIKEYNKEYITKTKSKEFQAAREIKEEDRSPEQKQLLTLKPVVQVQPNGVLYGPTDFIEKVEAINARELKTKKEELNFISDSKIFKSVFDGATTNNQIVLYEFLFKQ